MKSPFFIVGCVRSGTTLLRNLLRQHPHLLCPEETHFYRWADPFGMPGFMNPIGKWPILQKHRQIDTVDEDWFQQQLSAARSRRDLFQRYGEGFKQAKGASEARIFDKTPQNVYGLPLLLHDFPDAKFIHIVRNPLNVIASLLLGKVVAAPNVVAAANYWVEAVAIVNTCKAMLGDRLLEIRYEDLVASPGDVVAGLCRFVGEDPEQLRLTQHVHEEKNQFRSTLSEDDMRTASELCGAWASHYQYDLESELAERGTIGAAAGAPT